VKNLGLKTPGFAAALVPVLVIVAASAACATTTQQIGTATATALPWEGALGGLAAALTGNTAKIISVIAIFVAGIALIFGEDLGHFAKRLLMIVIAVAFLIGAGSFVTTITTGAHI
jgi:type IV secretory pathway VirB2 component (pilin)